MGETPLIWDAFLAVEISEDQSPTISAVGLQSLIFIADRPLLGSSRIKLKTKIAHIPACKERHFCLTSFHIDFNFHRNFRRLCLFLSNLWYSELGVALSHEKGQLWKAWVRGGCWRVNGPGVIFSSCLLFGSRY